MAYRGARRRAGIGWDLLGKELREALIARELLLIFASQEVANGDRMREAAQIALEAGDEPDYHIEHPHDIARPE